MTAIAMTNAPNAPKVAKATLLGFCLVLVAAGAATPWFADEWAGAAWAGVGAALLAAVLVALVHRQVARRGRHDDDPKLAGSRLQTLLGIAFAAKLLVLIGGIVALHLAGAKFASLAAFALAFAAAALLSQCAAAFVLARSMARAAGSTSNPPS